MSVCRLIIFQVSVKSHIWNPPTTTKSKLKHQKPQSAQSLLGGVTVTGGSSRTTTECCVSFWRCSELCPWEASGCFAPLIIADCGAGVLLASPWLLPFWFVLVEVLVVCSGTGVQPIARLTHPRTARAKVMPTRH